VQPRGQLAFAAVGTYQAAATAISGIDDDYILTTHGVATGGSNNGQLLVLPKVLAATEQPQTNVTFAAEVNHPIGSMVVFYATDVPVRRPVISVPKRSIISSSAPSASLAATASDPNSQALTYQWSLSLNTTQSTADPVTPLLSVPTAASTNISGYGIGEFAYTVTATNVDGLSASATTRLIVTSETQPILISNMTQQQATDFTLSADVYAPNTTTPTLLWQQIAGPGPATIASPSNASTACHAPFGGSYWFTLTATSGLLVTVLRQQVVVTGAGPVVVRAGGQWQSGVLKKKISGTWE
jgi:hypothetical protein